jgi:cell division protein FtsL
MIMTTNTSNLKIPIALIAVVALVTSSIGIFETAAAQSVSDKLQKVSEKLSEKNQKAKEKIQEASKKIRGGGSGGGNDNGGCGRACG